MFTAVLLGLSAFVSILWSSAFLLFQATPFRLFHISGNLLTAFITCIRTSSYVSNDEPMGWVLGWSDGFYLGYLMVEKGPGNQGPQKHLFVLTTKTFYQSHISKNRDERVHPKSITLLTRDCSSYYTIDYPVTKYVPPQKLFPCKPRQAEIIQDILDNYSEQSYSRVFLHGKTGSGKSSIAIQLCAELLKNHPKVSLVTTWSPTDPGDSFFRMFNKAKPGPTAPLVVLLDEIDLLVDDVLDGKIHISDACPMAIEMTSKKGFNHFFDAFDREIYKHVVIILTSNRSVDYFNARDSSLLRPKRIDLIREV